MQSDPTYNGNLTRRFKVLLTDDGYAVYDRKTGEVREFKQQSSALVSRSFRVRKLKKEMENVNETQQTKGRETPTEGRGKSGVGVSI